jgi:serine/threonine-protein kinase
VVGTAQYLSPEQARGETVDSRSDVYSTGCLLYELLTGRPPFVGESPVAVAYQHVREPASPPSTYDTELPPEIDSIVMKALAKRLEDRYQSAAAMRSDIERYLAGRPVQAPAVPVPPAEGTMFLPADTSPTAAAPSAAYYPQEEEPKRTGLWIILGVLLVALVGAAAYFVPQMLDNPPAQVQVPRVVGQQQAAAVAEIEDVGLVASVTTKADENAPKGEVISQDPNGDEYVNDGDTVTLVVSTGPPARIVPSVLTLSKADARRALVEQGFKVKVVVREDDITKDQVLDQDPQANTRVAAGSVVTIYVSDGPEDVPNVIGETEERARQLIEDAGFQVFVTHSNAPTTQPTGTVIEQNPTGPQPQGTSVTIVVSDYVAPTETPTLPTETPTTILPLP